VLAEVKLYPVEDGYGERLPLSGIPRRVGEPKLSAAIVKEITDATRQFGLPPLDSQVSDNVAVLRPR
jgi:hypothetical protein